MRTIVGICFALSIVWIGIYFFQRSQTITNYPSNGTTVIAFGDSLIEGVGATPGHDIPSLLSQKIHEPVINMGISGNTSADGLARISTVSAQNPKMVLVLFGGNDFLQRVPLEHTFQNIDSIVTQLQDAGAIVVLLGIKGGVLGDQYAEHFEAIAQKRGAVYVPNVLAGLLGHTELMSDGIHPNNAGYARIIEKIYPLLPL